MKDRAQKPEKAPEAEKALSSHRGTQPATAGATVGDAVNSAVNSIDAIDAERREKIEKIKKALADGTYRISNEEVAGKIIDHMREPKS